MRILLPFCLASLFFVTAAPASSVDTASDTPRATKPQVIRLSQPVFTDTDSETFAGDNYDNQKHAALPQMTLATLLTDSDAHLGKYFALETRIAKVCQRKGCFFIAQSGRHQVRISFKDYGFFIPTDSSGKTVTLTGVLVKKQLNDK